MADTKLTKTASNGDQTTLYDAQGLPCPPDKAVSQHVIAQNGDRFWINVKSDRTDEAKGTKDDDR